jgi:uncharacterized protein YuzB (UPF0349 family)
MEKVTVEFCFSNLVKGSLSIYYRLRELKYPGLKVKAKSCLGYCGHCNQYLFALVNQELVEAKTPDGLYQEIVYRMGRHLR